MTTYFDIWHAHQLDHIRRATEALCNSDSTVRHGRLYLNKRLHGMCHKYQEGLLVINRMSPAEAEKWCHDQMVAHWAKVGRNLRLYACT